MIAGWAYGVGRWMEEEFHYSDNCFALYDVPSRH